MSGYIIVVEYCYRQHVRAMLNHVHERVRDRKSSNMTLKLTFSSRFYHFDALFCPYFAFSLYRFSWLMLFLSFVFCSCFSCAQLAKYDTLRNMRVKHMGREKKKKQQLKIDTLSHLNADG